MSIIYTIYPNNLTSDPNDFAARVKIRGSADLETIVDRMVDQGSTTTRADIMAVLEDAMKSAEQYLLDGHRVNLGGLCQLYPCVRGIFTDVDDIFDENRHTLAVGARPGKRILNTMQTKGAIEKMASVVYTPSIVVYRDATSDMINTQITLGTIGNIKGSRLKFNKLQADEGIFFIDEADESIEHKVTLTNSISDQKLVFQVPARLVSSSTYFIEVRVRYTPAGDLRKGRSKMALEAVD